MSSQPADGEKPSCEELRTIALALGLLGDGRYSQEASEIHALAPLCDLRPADALEFICRVGLDLAYPATNFFGIVGIEKRRGKVDIILKGIEAIRSWPHLSLDPWSDDFNSRIEAIIPLKERRTTNLAERKLWQANMERWLACLPSGTGTSIREFVRTRPVYTPSMADR